MRRISRADFRTEFPAGRPAWNISTITSSNLDLHSDATVSAIHSGKLVVRPGVKVLLNGTVKGSVVVEKDAVLYLTGIVSGDLIVNGAACIDGIVEGELRADEAATLAVQGQVTKGVYPAA